MEESKEMDLRKVGLYFLYGVLSLLAMSWMGCGAEKPKICLENAECVGLGADYHCKNNQCLQKTEEEKKKELCPDSCAKDDDCAKCEGGLTACIGGACKKPIPKAETYGKCGDNGKSCGDKANCVVLLQGSSHGYCLPECDTTRPNCDADAGVCRPLRSEKGACIPKGKVGQGEACTFDPQAEKLDPSKACKSGLVCDKGKCAPPPEKGKYEKCTQLTACIKDTQCAIMQSGAAHGYCMPSCDPAKPECEAGKGLCESTSTALGLCFPKGTAVVGNACGLDPNAEQLETSKVCQPGLLCVEKKCEKPEVVGMDEICHQKRICQKGHSCIIFITGSLEGLCVPIVSKCTETVCGAGRKCLPRQDDSGICVKDCSVGQICPTGTTCTQIPTEQSIKACVPPPPPSPKP